ncbi:MAG: hypothetical protein FWG57_04305 [Endomicrobia bacterium]|nr:hypothetical protein [Endomicrobiia bacterium]
MKIKISFILVFTSVLFLSGCYKKTETDNRLNPAVIVFTSVLLLSGCCKNRINPDVIYKLKTPQQPSMMEFDDVKNPVLHWILTRGRDYFKCRIPKPRGRWAQLIADAEK